MREKKMRKEGCLKKKKKESKGTCVCTCLYVCLSHQVPEEGIRSHGARVTEDCEMLDVGLETELGSSARAARALNHLFSPKD